MPETSGERSPSWRTGHRLLLLVPLVAAVSCGSDDDAVETSDVASTAQEEVDEQGTTTSTEPPTTAAPTTAAPTTAPPTTAPPTTAAPTTAPPTTAAPTTATPGPAEAATSLTVVVTANGQHIREGTLVCGDTVEGTGHLADAEAAQAACDLLSDESARSRLVEGFHPEEMCTMQYGGPDVATVTGTVAGQAVDTTFSRQDGCAIADFDAFAPLIGPPSAGM